MLKKKIKTKSKLQRKIDNPNSILWRRKADKLWSDIVHIVWNHKCAICGSNKWPQAHHQIPREQYSHRHISRNGICLCAKHHRFSFDISAHKAPVAFIKWLSENHPEQWSWLLCQQPSRDHIKSFKEITQELEYEKQCLVATNKK